MNPLLQPGLAPVIASTSVQELRRQTRQTCDYEASCEGARGRVRGNCTNLSLGGAFLSGIQLPVGSLTTVTIELPGKGTLVLPAQVRRHSVSPRGMGVEFARLEPAQLELLQSVCGEDAGH